MQVPGDICASMTARYLFPNTKLRGRDSYVMGIRCSLNSWTNDFFRLKSTNVNLINNCICKQNNEILTEQGKRD